MLGALPKPDTDCRPVQVSLIAFPATDVRVYYHRLRRSHVGEVLNYVPRTRRRREILERTAVLAHSRVRGERAVSVHIGRELLQQLQSLTAPSTEEH
jgi:hypothetical protein